MLTTSDQGVIKQAKKSKFNSVASEIKEELGKSKLLAEMRKTTYSVGSIEDLKIDLQKEKQVLEQAQKEAQEFKDSLSSAENNISDYYQMLRDIKILYINYVSQSDETEKEKIEQNIRDKIQQIDNIVAEAEFVDGAKLLDGNLNYTKNFGNEKYNYGSINVTVPDCSFKKLIGMDEIDFLDQDKMFELIDEAMSKMIDIQTDFGVRQMETAYVIKYFKLQIEGIDELISSIFFDTEGNELTDEEAIKSAKSNNTTIKLIKITQKVIDSIIQEFEAMIEKSENAKNDTNTDGDRRTIQKEIEHFIKEIDRELNYTVIINKNLFQGDFLYVPKTTVNSLGVRGLSVLTKSEATNTQTKAQKAITKMQEIKDNLDKKIAELENKKDQEADSGAGLEIEINPTIFELNEKYKDKFKIVNGELLYIGTDEDEKEWAKELEIATE